MWRAVFFCRSCDLCNHKVIVLNKPNCTSNRDYELGFMKDLSLNFHGLVGNSPRRSCSILFDTSSLRHLPLRFASCVTYQTRITCAIYSPKAIASFAQDLGTNLTAATFIPSQTTFTFQTLHALAWPVHILTKTFIRLTWCRERNKEQQDAGKLCVHFLT